MARLTTDVTLAPIDHLIPVAAHRGRDSWLLTFDCPWCQRTHAHGGGPLPEPPAAGHRLSHCRHPAAPPGYVLVVAAERASPPRAARPGAPLGSDITPWKKKQGRGRG